MLFCYVYIRKVLPKYRHSIKYFNETEREKRKEVNSVENFSVKVDISRTNKMKMKKQH